jgi:hypothetical protein
MRPADRLAATTRRPAVPVKGNASMTRRLALALLATLAAAALADGPDHATPMKALLENQLRAEIVTPKAIAALIERNAANAGVDQARVDALDRQWRAEVKAGGGPLLNETLAAPLSDELRNTQKLHRGLITEVFIMDNLGLNVAQSDPTSDYWQGDEAKWQKTFSVGPDAVFVDGIEKDESTQSMQSQISFAIVDPSSGRVIGAATVGIDVDLLLQ